MQGNNWKLSVDHYGKIEHADIEMAPLTVFVGDNNSGKSYLMTLIYGLLTLPAFILFGGMKFESKVEKDARDFILAYKGQSHLLSEQELQILENLLNKQLQHNKKHILPFLFNRQVKIDRLTISLDYHAGFSLFFDEQKEDDGTPLQIVFPEWSKEGPNSGYAYHMENPEDEELEWILCTILQYLLRKTYNEYSKKGDVVYFPVARTGFLLTYKDLTGNAINEKYSNEKPDQKDFLTKPNRDFINKLARLSADNRTEKNQSLINFIENHLISGNVITEKTPVMSVAYKPSGENDTIPLYATSAVVTEETPLLLFLQYAELSSIFYEEPEISLHPALQKEHARILVRLVNYGMPVFVTTHSDIVIQHFNNMIRLAKANKSAELMKSMNYDKEDLLASDQIRVYQFDVNESQHTKIHQIECGEYGFEVMTFYQTLRQMTEEIDMLEEDE